MSSPKSENHVNPPISITAKPNLFSNDSALGYSCNNSNNLSFAVGHNLNTNNATLINNNNISDKSSLLALNMINQALNFSLLQPNSSSKQFKISPQIQFTDVQKFNENKMNANINPFLINEYQKIKQQIDKSGMLLPNEKLVTQNRGECYWFNCFFQSDIEENFKKHLNECHHVTSSALAQLEISFEKAMQLSKLLLHEQNHLYNMFLHLDQKLKNLANENPTLPTDNQYIAALLNKFKQMPNIFDFINESNRFGGDANSFHSSHRLDGHQFPLNNNHHTQQPSPLQQQQPPMTMPSLTNIPQQLIENISSALMRQQQQQQQMNPLSSQNNNHQTTFQQSISSPQIINQPNHSAFTNNILPLLNANNSNNVNVNNNIISNSSTNNTLNTANTNNLVIANPDSALINISPNNQLTNIDNNLKDILSQPRSSDSNYTRSDPDSNHMKDNKIKSAKRASSSSQLSFFPKGMTDREYYRQFPVRPSASYVNLIKTAILESPRHELSLNEIYVWMQTEFAYFRDKEQKWKNAIRHNLSLHKCFQRKHGKLWTFNENEYNMKKSRNRFQYNVPLPGAENQINDPDSFEDEDDIPEQFDHSEYMIKKEMEFNDENMPEEKHMEIDEWSNYLHKTSLITSNEDNIKPSVPDISVD